MADSAAVSSKKSFREAFFAEAERKDPNKKTIWEVILVPFFILTVLFVLGTLVVTAIAFFDWHGETYGNAAAVSNTIGTAVLPFLN